MDQRASRSIPRPIGSAGSFLGSNGRFPVWQSEPDGVWNSRPLILGSYYLWIDGSGRLRVKSGAPSSATDGTVVGTQS